MSKLFDLLLAANKILFTIIIHNVKMLTKAKKISKKPQLLINKGDNLNSQNFPCNLIQSLNFSWIVRNLNEQKK